METQIFPNDPNNQQLQSYWDRPGGKFGIIVGLGLVLIAGYFVLPILTTIVWNTLNFGIALLCLGLFLFLVTNRKLRLSIFYLYEILMRKLVGVVIELDPFIIAQDYINDMEKSRQKLYDQSVQVDGQKENIDAKIKEKLDEKNKMLARAKAAQQNNMIPELQNATRQAARLDEYVAKLTPIRDSLAKIGDYLTKVYKNSAYTIEDAKNELDLKKDMYKSVTAGNAALTSALKIFNGDPEKKLMVEQSMEYLKDDIANKLASMKKSIEVSSDFMRSIDLDNATAEVQGLQMLETYNPDDLKIKTSPVTKSETVIPGKVTSNYKNLLD